MMLGYLVISKFS